MVGSVDRISNHHLEIAYGSGEVRWGILRQGDSASLRKAASDLIEALPEVYRELATLRVANLLGAPPAGPSVLEPA